MKTLLTIAIILGTVFVSNGQGTINFSAGATVATRISTNLFPGGPTLGLTGRYDQGYAYYYALFVADSTITSVANALDPTLTPGWSQAIWDPGNPAGLSGGIYATNSFAGRFVGNATTDGVFVQGRANGSSASFIVVGWSSQVAGPDWASAKPWIDEAVLVGFPPSVGWVGASGVATSVQLGGGLNPAGNLFGSSPGQLSTGFVLSLPVPEPNSFAFVGFGAATLLIFRCRRMPLSTGAADET